jgi:hypothetical protein
MQAAKNDVGFLQLIDSGLHSPYCAFVKARSLLGHATQRTMEIVHVTPATIFHVRQALTVEGQLALVLLNALNYGHGRNLLLLAIIQDCDDEGRQSRRANFRLTHYQMPGHFQGRPADAPSHDACWAACAAGVSGGGVDQAYDGWRVVSQFEFQQWVEAV